MERSESIVNLTKAMLNAQKNIGAAIKGSKNPFFRSSYADLPSVMESCKDALNDAGILVTQMLDSLDSGDYLVTLFVHGETGEFMGSKMKIYNHKDIQGTMSEQTYLRRYMLQALAFIPSVDDDGNAASGKNEEPKGRAPVKVETKVETKPEVKPEARVRRPVATEATKPVETKVETKPEVKEETDNEQW